MTKRVLILYGQMANREVDMPDDDAANAISQQWAMDPFVPNYPQAVPKPPVPTPAETALRTQSANEWVAVSRGEGPKPAQKPTISLLNPATMKAGDPGLSCTVTGQHYVNGAVVVFGAANMATTFVSATQLRFTIPSEGASAGPIQVTVRNPDAQSSDPKTFTFTA